ncbi:tyrosine-type recombinase/integrase [Granulicella cerasi]|uniref:Tyrosine-type recombinase/integrase n=1 Tax=Granulicella cerasi TaxID=741063 RepID=A0ABW1Z5K1_9BACT
MLSPEQIKLFLEKLVDLPKTAVLLGASTGLRVGEILGLKWEDVDFETLELRVTRDVVKQRIERCKTEASRKPVPIGAEVAEILFAWRSRCAYNQPADWVFASPAKKGNSRTGRARSTGCI